MRVAVHSDAEGSTGDKGNLAGRRHDGGGVQGDRSERDCERGGGAKQRGETAEVSKNSDDDQEQAAPGVLRVDADEGVGGDADSAEERGEGREGTVVNE